MHVIFFLLFGLVIGAIARLLVPGNERGGWLTSMGVGVAGSMLGGFVGQVVGFYRPGEPAGFFMSLAGAAIILFGYHAIVGRTAKVTG